MPPRRFPHQAPGDPATPNRSPRQSRNETPGFAQVFINPRQAPRFSLRVPADIFRRVTWALMSCSGLLC